MTRRHRRLATRLREAECRARGGALAGARTPPPRCRIRALPSAADAAQQVASDITLWYRRPAAQWVEALPVGNGRLGAMVFGGVEQRAAPAQRGHALVGRADATGTIPRRREVLPEVRRLIAAGKYAEADALASRCRGRTRSPICRWATCSLPSSTATSRADYRRELDLRLGRRRRALPGRRRDFTREVFAQHPDQVIVVRPRRIGPGRSASPRRSTAAARTTIAPAPTCWRCAAARRRMSIRATTTRADPVATTTTAACASRRASAPSPRRAADAAATAARGGRRRSRCFLLAAATSFNGYDQSPVRDGRDAGAVAGRQLRAAPAAVATPTCARRMSPITARCSTASRSTLGPATPTAATPTISPTDERICDRGRDGSAARRAALPVRPLPADRQLAARHAAGEPAGHLERQTAAAVELATTRSTSTRR